MIGSLRGRLLDRSVDEVLVEVAGLGYRVVVSPTTALALGEVGREVLVWTHHHVREDAETLYGFSSREERVSFEVLLGAHGVGPSLALAILSVHAPAELVRLVHGDDVAALCLVPGIGKKTATRLLVELKARLDLLDADWVPPGADSLVRAVPGPESEAGVRADVRAALVELGYGSEEIRMATTDLPDEGDAALLLRAALATLATGQP